MGMITFSVSMLLINMMKMLVPVFFLLFVSRSGKNWWVLQVYLLIISGAVLAQINIYGGWSNLSYHFGWDGLAFILIVLSFWICSLMVLASEGVLRSGFYSSMFMTLVVALLVLLVGAFSSLNMLSFYFFFEGSLIPTLLLILGWGYQPERVQAGVYLIFYTLVASMPLLVSVVSIYKILNSMSFCLMWGCKFSSIFLYMGLITAFMVKMPMFLVHLWLPKAHVEAPVSGSMILAGVLLKLGGYGLMRVLGVVSNVGLKVNFVWVSVSLVGGVLVSLVCLRQTDLKSLVAYSSVVHMGLMLSGIMTLSSWGFSGGVAIMVAHGLCSSGLFCLVNIIYERTGSRSLLVNRGLVNFMPSMALWWFMLSASNMAAPPSLNLLGEISLLNAVVGWAHCSMIGLMAASFLGAAYSLYFYSKSQHGNVYTGSYAFSGGTVREFLLMSLHWIPLNFLILSGEICFLWS
uniref:NADH dehydrogenase subunit 4 n=1 Tax=Apachyus feae TaxID=2914707 RepID=UPI001EF9F8D9|nr:NADH dehydrogenase subunit 4 [Apachyus feae]UKE80569.1 NADH dehydrogenase subunit 4 [Apachyus feae]